MPAKVKVVKKGMSAQEVKKILERSETSNPRGVDTHKYCGVLNWKIDGLEFQKKMREEWDREIRSS